MSFVHSCLIDMIPLPGLCTAPPWGKHLLSYGRMLPKIHRLLINAHGSYVAAPHLINLTLLS